MAQHHRLKIDASVQVYFCNPQSSWQRGTNDNINGLLRQYFLNGTELSIHSAHEIAAVAAALNVRPRRPWAGKRRQRRLTSCCHEGTQLVLRRPLESAQYASGIYQELLAAHDLIGSMSRRGNPYDNAKAESFMKTLKAEAIYPIAF